MTLQCEGQKNVDSLLGDIHIVYIDHRRSVDGETKIVRNK